MAKKLRQRVEGPALASWAQVDHALREIGELTTQVEGMEARHQQTVNQSKVELEAVAQPLLDRRALLERQIKEYVEANKDDLGKKKSRPLNFGVVGFRQSTSIVIRNAKAILAALKAKKMLDCITVKESISKEALKGYPDEVLAEVGASRKTEDTFFYEVNRDALERMP